MRSEAAVTRPQPRVAMISVHTSPLAQPGSGDAGGMNVYVAELARALAQRGVAADVFTRRTASHEPEQVQMAPGVTVHNVLCGPYGPVDKADLPGQLCAFTAAVLREAAHRPDGWYDVVHSHYWLSGQVGWLLADRWNVPLVHTMHTMALVKNRDLAAGDIPEPRMRIVGESQVVAEADLLIASTTHERDDLVGLYGADPHRVAVIAPGVDTVTFRPEHDDRIADQRAARAQLGLAGDEPLLVYAGRLQKLKAPDVVVDALAWLRARGVEPPRFVVLGDDSGRPGARRELTDLAALRGVADRVGLLPPVPHAALAPWLRAADAVVVPSHSESYGLVALEAQACGTPVIAAQVGGLVDAVADGVSGVLVPDHQPGTWGAAIGHLLAHPDERARLSTGALARASQQTWNATARAVMAGYRGVIRRGRRVQAA